MYIYKWSGKIKIRRLNEGFHPPVERKRDYERRSQFHGQAFLSGLAKVVLIPGLLWHQELEKEEGEYELISRKKRRNHCERT